MKYNEKNPPLVCMQTQSKCYKGTRKMTVKGILWHDTGSNNAYIKRYVQPSDNAPDREEMLKILGKNQYNNDWNHSKRNVGMNCFVGKLADGTVATVQTMPWDYRPWGCGSGSKGSCNSGWIQFEICEDGKNNAEYLEAAYREACEITAYLCLMFGIDPHGTADCGGVTVPTILCHQDSYKLGLGSNHSDIYDWFPKFGKSMETVRDDVAALIRADTASPEEDEPENASQSHPEAPVSVSDSTLSTALKSGCKGSAVALMQSMLIACGYTLPKYGADGSFGAETTSAVIQFQRDQGLTMDGIMGKKTYAALLNAYSAVIASSDSEKVYTVTVSGLTKADAEKIIAIYGGELSVG